MLATLAETLVVTLRHRLNSINISKIVSWYDQEIPQSQTADKPMASWEEPRNNHETPGRQTAKQTALSSPLR